MAAGRSPGVRKVIVPAFLLSAGVIVPIDHQEIKINDWHAFDVDDGVWVFPGIKKNNGIESYKIAKDAAIRYSGVIDNNRCKELFT